MRVNWMAALGFALAPMATAMAAEAEVLQVENIPLLLTIEGRMFGATDGSLSADIMNARNAWR